jgi:Domain of unknown function (DUF1929)/Bacterial Ig domain
LRPIPAAESRKGLRRRALAGRRRGLVLATLAVGLGLMPLASTSAAVDAIGFRGATSAANASTTTLVLPLPAGVAPGDVLLASVAVRGGPSITAPSGWSLARLDMDGSFVRQAMYVKVASTSEPASFTWTLSAAKQAAGGIAAFTGVDTTNPVDASAGQVNASATSLTAPSVTTTVPDTMLVAFYGVAPLTQLSPPAGMTERWEVPSPAGATYPLVSESASGVQPAAGATGVRTATAAKAVRSIGQLVALRPGSGGPPPPPPPPGNTAPTAGSTSATTERDAPVNITLSGTDVDTCELSFTVEAEPTHGTLTAPAAAACTPGSPNRDTATVTYTPASGYTGSDSFTYWTNDGELDSAPATVTLTVQAPPPPPGSGITFRAASSAANGTATSLVVPKPAGASAGDVLLASVAVRGNPAIAAPSGWSLVRTDPRGTILKQAVYAKAVTAAEPASYMWTFSVSKPAAGGIAAFTGVDTANPVNASGGQANLSATTVTAPSVTTTVPDTMLVALYGFAPLTGLTPSAGMTERWEVGSTPGTPSPVVSEGATALQAAAGATGTRIATAGKAVNSVGQLVALRPGGGGPPPPPPPGNTAPAAGATSATTVQETPVAVTLSGTDSETCELTFTIVTPPAHGTLDTPAAAACTAGSPNRDTAGVTYTPAAGYTGGDSFTYKVGDGALESVPATVTLTVNSAGPGGGPEDIGSWGPVFDLGGSAVHSVLMHNGKILLWRTSQQARVYDPTDGSITPVPTSIGNFFCGAHVVLADGRVLAIGGEITTSHGIKTVATFDPSTNAWTQVASMSFARWYPTPTFLSDGRVLVGNGNNESGSVVNAFEIYDPATNSWTTLSGADRAQPLYAYNFLLPNGKIFEAAPKTATGFLDLATNSWSPGPTGPYGTTGSSESAALYEPGKIMRFGGGDPAHARTAVIDMNASTPVWQETAPMAFARRRANSVILADGSVMAIGGTGRSDDANAAVFAGEIWNPVTKTWKTVASMEEGRMYHSSAVLLPDGRVYSAGGNNHTSHLPNWTGKRAQIYSPPYLFQGPRPTISSAPGSASYGATFTVGSPDAADIASVALIRPSATTHAYNMEQRYIPLSFSGGGGSLTVTAPTNRNVAPPGYYMLVLKNSAGVPSVARFVRLG